MLSKIKVFGLVILMISLIISTSQLCLAQDEKAEETEKIGKIEEIEISEATEEKEIELIKIKVTSQKKKEDIFDVPAAITALDSKRIEDLHINDLTDLSAVSPNVNIIDCGHSGNPMVVLRGFNSMNPDGALTGLYLDGIFIGNMMSMPPVLYNMERIEILKGPQGTLYGRNTMGGVINIISKPPVNEVSGYVSTEYGNFNNTITSGEISFPLVNNKLFLKLGGFFKSFDGFFHNQTLDKKAGGITAGAGNVAIKIKPSSSSEFDIRYEYRQKSEEHYPFHSTPELANEDPDTIYHNVTGTIKAIGHDGVFKSRFSIKNIDIINIMGINAVDNEFKDMEFDYTSLDVMSFGGDIKDFSLSDELRIQSDRKDINLKWLAGLFGSYDNREQNTTLIYGEYSGMTLFPYEDMDKSSLSTLTGSAFGELTYTFFKQLAITGGLRYDYDYKESEIQNVQSYMGQTMIEGEKYKESAKYKALSPKFAVSYNINDTVRPFITVTKGYHAGGINTYNHIPGKIKYDPEYCWNYEAGIKSRLFNKRLNANASIFYADWKDQQILIYWSRAEYGVQNVGSSEVYGGELEIQALVADGFTVDALGGYNKATLKEFDITSYNSMTGLMEKINLKGKSQALTPLFNGLVGLQYAKEFIHSENLSYKPIIRGEAKYTGEHYYAVENRMKNMGYVLYNAHIGLGLNNFEFMFWVKNIFNKKYFRFAYDKTGYNSVLMGAPRTFGAKVSYKF